MSSVSVSCCQSPASAMAARRQMPAVPLKLKKRPDQLRPACSMMKCPSSMSASTSVSAEKSRLTCSQRHCTTATLRVAEVVDRPLEDVGQRQEVGVEDEDELALGASCRPFCSAPALKPLRSTRWMYSTSSSGKLPREVGDLAPADLLRLVGAVVEHLDLEAVARVADAAPRRRAAARRRTSR